MLHCIRHGEVREKIVYALVTPRIMEKTDILKSLLYIVSLILVLSDLASQPSPFHSQTIESNDGNIMLTNNWFPVIIIGVVWISTFVPRFQPAILFMRFLQVGLMLALKISVQHFQLHLEENSFTPGYAGFSILCGLVVFEVGPQLLYTEDRNTIVCTIISSVGVVIGLLCEMAFNPYQDEMNLKDFVFLSSGILITSVVIFSLKKLIDWEWTNTLVICVLTSPISYVITTTASPLTIPPSIGMLATGEMVYLLMCILAGRETQHKPKHNTEGFV